MTSPEVSTRLEHILAYLQCPLKARYLAWGAKMAPKNTKERVVWAVEKAVGVFLMKMSMDPKHGFTAGIRATSAFETSVFPNGINDVKDAGLALYGLDILRRFSSYFDWTKDRAICGPLPDMPVVVDDCKIIGDITGIVATDYGTDDEQFCVIHVGRGEKPRPTWERVLESFQYLAVRQAAGLSVLRQKPVRVVRLDPYAKTVSKLEMTGTDRALFEALVPAAAYGLAHDMAVPHQSALNCGRCYFESACNPKYARLVVSKINKKEFMDAHKKEV